MVKCVVSKELNEVESSLLTVEESVARVTVEFMAVVASTAVVVFPI